MRQESRPSNRPIRWDLVRALILEAFAAIRSEGRVADRTLDYLLRRERRLWAAERRAVAEGVYALLRAELRLAHHLERALGATYRNLGPAARHALLLEAWRVTEGKVEPKQALRESGLSAALLPGLLACQEGDGALPADPVDRLAVAHALPRWIAALLQREVGDEAEALAAAMDRRAPLTLRANTLRIDREGLVAKLAAEGVEARPTPYAPHGVIAEARQNLFHLAAFREGLFEVQDEGSQLLALLLAPHPGERVVDACAGAGGKTLALAAMMENRGRIVALDTHPRRLSQLGPRARRAGIHNWESHEVDDTTPGDVERRWHGKADAVLVDAPCTGLGVLRRNPDTLFRLQPEDAVRFAGIQRGILHRYADLVRPGGRLVYGTCSLAREENEEVVERFLAEREDFELAAPASALGGPLAERLGASEHLRLFPHRQGTDGFFGALLVRKG